MKNFISVAGAILGAALLIGSLTAPGWIIQGGANFSFLSYFGVQPPPGYAAAVPVAMDLAISEVGSNKYFPDPAPTTVCSVTTNGSSVINVADCSWMDAAQNQTGGTCIKAADGGSCVTTASDSTHIHVTGMSTGSWQTATSLCINLGCDTRHAFAWVVSDDGSCGPGCEAFTLSGGAASNATYIGTAPIVTAYKLYDLLGTTACDGLPCDMPYGTIAGQHGWTLLFSGFGNDGSRPCLFSPGATTGVQGHNLSSNNLTPAGPVTISTVGKRAVSANGNSFLSAGNNGIDVVTSGSTRWRLAGPSSDVAAPDAAFHVAIGHKDATGANNRFNVDGTEASGGDAVNTSAARPKLDSSTSVDLWFCEGGFAAASAATATYRKTYCNAESGRWPITPSGAAC